MVTKMSLSLNLLSVFTPSVLTTSAKNNGIKGQLH